MLLIFNILILSASTAFIITLLSLKGRVSNLIAVFLIATGSIVVIAEAVSLVHALSGLAFTIGGLILLLLAGTLWWRRGRPDPLAALRLADLRRELTDSLRNWRQDWPLWLLVAGVIFFLAIEAAFSWQDFDAHFDTATYHYPKLALWLDNHSIFFFDPAARANIFDHRILDTPPVSDALYLFIFAGTGTLRGLQIVEWLSLFPVMLAIYGLASPVTGRKPALCAALTFSTMGISLANTHQAGAMVSSAALLMAALYFLSEAERTHERSAVMLCCAGLALALAAKATVYFAMPGVAVLLVWHLIRGVKARGWAWLTTWLAAGAISLAVFAAPYVAQNIAIFAKPLPSASITIAGEGEGDKDGAATCLRHNLIRYSYWAFFPKALPAAWQPAIVPAYQNAWYGLGEVLHTPWTGDACTKGGDFGYTTHVTFTIAMIPLTLLSLWQAFRRGSKEKEWRQFIAWGLIISFYIALSMLIPIRSPYYRYLVIPAALFSITFADAFALVEKKPIWLALLATLSLYNMGHTVGEKTGQVLTGELPPRETLPGVISALLPEDARILGAFNATGALDSTFYGDHLSRSITLSDCADLAADMAAVPHDFVIIADVYPESTFEGCLEAAQAARGDNALAETLRDAYALRYETWYTAFNHLSLYQRLDQAGEVDLYPLAFPPADERVFIAEALAGIVGGGPVDYFLKGIGLPGEDYLFSVRADMTQAVSFSAAFSGEACRADRTVHVRAHDDGYALIFDERVMLSDDGELAFDMVLSPGITRLFFDEGDCDMGAPALVFERMDVSPG